MAVNHQRDQRIVIGALESARDQHIGAATDLMDRRMPDPRINSKGEVITDVAFERSETPVVVGALAIQAEALISQRRRHPLLWRRTKSLIGELVTAAGAEYYYRLREPNSEATPASS